MATTVGNQRFSHVTSKYMEDTQLKTSLSQKYQQYLTKPHTTESKQRATYQL